MHFSRMLLVFTALITLVYSLPTGLEQNNTANFAQNVTSTYDAPEDKKPLTVILEDKNPKSDSVVVEFVYNSNGGNLISESKGTDKDKYSIDSSSNKEKQMQSLNEKVKEKPTQKVHGDTEAQKKVNEPKSDPNQMVNNLHVKPQASLMPEEISPLSNTWPKYFYDAFNPIYPFPELHYNKPNQMNTQNENANSYVPYYEKGRKEQMNVAGPGLSPLSIYDREFNVPIFD